jgi:hypothetical protein
LLRSELGLGQPNAELRVNRTEEFDRIHAIEREILEPDIFA